MFTIVGRRVFAAATLVMCAMLVTACSEGSEPQRCGSPIEKASGEKWECTFADEFDGDSLEIGNWQLMNTPVMGFTQESRECYLPDAAHVDVSDGSLRLTSTETPAPAPCGVFNTPYQSGMVFSKHRFSQTFGRFEVRAKLPEGPGYQPAIWMYPEDLAYGERSGEIDIAETFGDPELVAPHLHLKDAQGVDRPKGAYCRVEGAADSFHTYAVEWLPSGEFTFLYDGEPCLHVPEVKPDRPLSAPQPFDKPFYILLQLGLGYGENLASAATPFPRTLEVDYVRVWE